MSKFKLSTDELLALLDRQSPDFASEMADEFAEFLADCRAQNHEPSTQDVVTMAAAKVRAMNAAMANEIASAQIEKLVEVLRGKGAKT